jgi:DNA primase
MVLLFDGDAAGARAAERAFAFLETFPVQPVVLILPAGQDPADFVRANGAEELRSLAARAVPLVEYMLRRTVARHDLGTVEGQAAAVAAALPMLEGLGDPVRRSEYAHVLADLVGVSEGSVALALDRRMTGRPVELRETIKRASAQERVEREMLRLLARDGEIFSALAPKVAADDFQLVRNRDLFTLLVETGGDIGGTVSRSQDDRVVAALSSLTLEPLDGEPTLTYAEDVWVRLQEFALQRRSASLRHELQKMNPQTDPRYDTLFQELVGTDGELRRIRERRRTGDLHVEDDGDG